MIPLYNSKQNKTFIVGALTCFFYLFLFSIPTATAVTWNIDHITVTTNASLYWITDSLGALGDVDSSQFESSNGTLTLNESWIDEIETNISINYGANESDTSGPPIPFLLTSEGILKIEAVSVGDEIWEQIDDQIINLEGNTLNFSGGIIASDNITATTYYGDGSQLTGVSGGIWTNVSGVATYDGSANVTGNITATTYYGDGSQLTGVNGGIWTNVSGVATYDGPANVTGNITLGETYTFEGFPTTYITKNDLGAMQIWG